MLKEHCGKEARERIVQSTWLLRAAWKYQASITSMHKDILTGIASFFYFHL
jgi:predicted Rdx family selenoprotein